MLPLPPAGGIYLNQRVAFLAYPFVLSTGTLGSRMRPALTQVGMWSGLPVT